MPGLFARVFNKGQSALEEDLKRVTESGVIEIPQDLINPVVEAAHCADNRREIMRHLQNCLSEPSGKRWRRVYAGLVLAESLTQKGPQELLVETSEGLHFDLVQRLAFLEIFDYSDRRIQQTLRNKAKALRAELVPRLQDAADDNCASWKDTASTESGDTSVASVDSAGIGSTVGPVGFGNSDVPAPAEKPEGLLILNGIVAVGHHDDTTSESDNEQRQQKAVQYRKTRSQRNAQVHQLRSRGATESDGSEHAQVQPEQPAVAKTLPPVMVDLL